MQKIGFYSEEYSKLLATDHQRTDLNLHYHQEGIIPDVNALLFNKLSNASLMDAKILTKDVTPATEEGINNLKFP